MTVPRYTTADDLADRQSAEELEYGWMRDSACAGADLDLFFTSPTPDTVIARFCRRCPVRTDCLKFAQDRRIAFGIFGGMTPQQRREVA